MDEENDGLSGNLEDGVIGGDIREVGVAVGLAPVEGRGEGPPRKSGPSTLST